MEVYIVIYTLGDDFKDFVGIFTTLEKAQLVTDMFYRSYGELIVYKVDTDKLYLTSMVRPPDRFGIKLELEPIGEEIFRHKCEKNKTAEISDEFRALLHKNNHLDSFSDQYIEIKDSDEELEDELEELEEEKIIVKYVPMPNFSPCKTKEQVENIAMSSTLNL
jgi:predicted transcriptional regulator